MRCVQVALVVAAWLSALACGPGTYERTELMNPETCARCHPNHYKEWSGSMHAYAADDPVFLAMNKKGQRETNGQLGDFCVKCHAPLALIEGATTDGSNMESVPRVLKGVTCFYCHTVESVEGDHNNPLLLSEDPVMRGGIPDPVDNEAHDSEYSALHDRALSRSSNMCGPCHDIVNGNGVAIERTYSEWKGSLYSHETYAELQSCGRCHMPGRDGLVAEYPGVKLRRVQSHTMAAVDVALTPFPEMEAQRNEVQKTLDHVLYAQLCVTRVGGGIQVDLDLENLAAGHAFPSGASADRRAFVELVGSFEGAIVFESGVVADGQRLVDLNDPNLWRMGDRFYDETGAETHDFWKVTRIEGEPLPVPTALAPWDPAYTNPHVKKSYMIPGLADRITVRVRLTPIGHDVLDALIDSGDLDPVYRARMPTFDLGSAALEWTPDKGEGCFPEA